MHDIERTIRFETIRTEELRRDAAQRRQLRTETVRPGAKAALAALLRTAAERLDPAPRVPRPRSA